MATKLNLGCNLDIREGYLNVDSQKIPGVFRYDLSKMPRPWESHSIDHILARHIVEHIPDFVGFMRECERVLKSGATLEIHYPDYRSRQAWDDPTHIRCITPRVWKYFTAESFYPWGFAFRILENYRMWYHIRVLGKWIPLPFKGGENRVVLVKGGSV